MSKHIQKDFEGSRIHKWELNHGIVRIIKDGCEYVTLVDPGKFAAACEQDDVNYARLKMKWAAEETEVPDDIF